MAILPVSYNMLIPLLYGTMQYSMLLLFTTFLAFPIWPQKLKEKRLMIWIWPLSIFYTFFVAGSILIVLRGFATSQILIFMLNFVMAALLIAAMGASDYFQLGISILPSARQFGGMLR